MPANIIFALINICTGLLIVSASLPLLRGKVPMNNWYGIRVKKSFDSDANWYAINAYGGKQLVAFSPLLFIPGLLCFWIPFNEANKDVLSLVFGVLPITVYLVVTVIRIILFGKKLP